jgi:replicative DNA helicase
MEPHAPPPPHDFEIEMGLLAVLMANNQGYEKVADTLLAEHFADARHGRIYDAIARLVGVGRQANAVTLKAFFANDIELAEIGGTEYLARLQASAILVVNPRDYADRLVDLFRRRSLISLAHEIASRAHQFTLAEDSLDLIQTLEGSLFNLAEHGSARSEPVAFNKALGRAIDIAQSAFRRGSTVTGVTTGFREMDRTLGGLQPSDLVILAGRPAMGKTALATKMAFKAAEARLKWRDDMVIRGESADDRTGDGAVVALFSLEMSAEQLANRVLSDCVGIPSDKIRRGDVSADAFPAFVQAAASLARLPLYIDDTPGMSVATIRARARRMMRKSSIGLGLIVIDYLQLLVPSAGQRAENRVQEISAITRGLKQLAKELGVPVLALSQLSRAVEAREDKHPQLADLRESGTIEQDADVVLFVYRDHYYLSQAVPKRRPQEDMTEFNSRYQAWEESLTLTRDEAEVLIAKHRHGSTGTIGLRFEGEFTRFSDRNETDKPSS